MCVSYYIHFIILKYFVALSVHLGANILLCEFLFTAVQSISPLGGGGAALGISPSTQYSWQSSLVVYLLPT